jgi:DNA-binding transcriptional LysR family regulator
MLDLELLNTLICVVDEGSFTRAGERVHRTQSTVSQQVRKLEESVGRTLLLRDRTGNQVTATEHGEMLAHYARRLLALSQEAQDALASDVKLTPVRIGVPEDFDARRMSAMLSGFVKAKPGVRLETVAGMSVDLQRKLAGGELEICRTNRRTNPSRWRCFHKAACIGNARFAASTRRSGAGASRSEARVLPGFRRRCRRDWGFPCFRRPRCCPSIMCAPDCRHFRRWNSRS